MNNHLAARNKRYYINADSKSFNTTLEGLAVIELCISETCTRTCGFCPRGDSTVYKNRPLYMTRETITNIATRCVVDGYNGDFHISGFGEPLLHPDIKTIISTVRRLMSNHIVVTTNGDLLETSVIKSLYGYGVNHIIVSCYDGPEEKANFIEMFSLAGIDESRYEIRELWNGDDESITDFAKRNNFNNRSGAATNLNLTPIAGQCYLPFYKLVLDWNGDALLCCNDWLRKSKGYGNINKSSLKDIWYGQAFTTVRKNLFSGNRTDPACTKCSINGTLVGAESVTLITKKIL